MTSTRQIFCKLVPVTLALSPVDMVTMCTHAASLFFFPTPPCTSALSPPHTQPPTPPRLAMTCQVKTVILSRYPFVEIVPVFLAGYSRRLHREQQEILGESLEPHSFRNHVGIHLPFHAPPEWILSAPLLLLSLTRLHI